MAATDMPAKPKPKSQFMKNIKDPNGFPGHCTRPWQPSRILPVLPNVYDLPDWTKSLMFRDVGLFSRRRMKQ